MLKPKSFNFAGNYWHRASRNHRRIENLLRLLQRANREKLLMRKGTDPSTPPQGKTLLEVLGDAGMLDDEDDEECERACVECATLYTGSLACPTCSAPGEPLTST